MARTRHNENVSLFPFLAVLVCAMGALILLLLVITRQIRSQAKAQAEAVEIEEPYEQPTPSAPLVDLAARDASDAANRSLAALLPTQSTPVTPPPKFLTRPIPAQPTLVPSNVVPAVIASEPEDPNVKLKIRLAALAREVEQQSRSTNSTNEKLAGALSEAQLLQQQLKSAEAKLAALRVQKQNAEAGVGNASSEIKALQSQIARAENELLRARANVETKSTEYTFVAFDGQNGTVRRPIVIECTPKGYKFVQEGISLKEDDFAGFTAEVNPLFAGTRALVEYWASKSSAAKPVNDREEDPSAPYVLLIVRPGGAAAYYAARKMLAPLKTAFGYELFDANHELHTPPTDPEAKDRCQKAISHLMAMREQVMQRVLAGGPGAGGRVAGVQGGNGYRPGAGGRNSRDASQGNGLGGVGQNGVRQGGVGQTGVGQAGVGQTRRPSGIGGPPELIGGSNNPGDRASSQHGFSDSIPREVGLPETGTLPPFQRASPRAQVADGTSSTGSGNPDNAEKTATGAATSSGSSANSVSAATPPPPGQPNGASGQPNVAGGQPPAPIGAATPTPSPFASEPEESLFPDFDKEIAKSNGASSSGRPSTFRRNYGQRRRGSIGLERPVSIRVESDRILIAKKFAISLANQPSREELTGQVMGAIDRLAASWGDPPSKFYWVPSAEFVLPPGARANQVFETLRDELKKSGIPSSAKLARE